jgi:hypothetical protein
MAIETTTAPSFDPMARHASLDAANEYLALHGKAESFAAVADQGEYILIARSPAKAESPEAPKADPKPRKGQGKAKGKAKKAEAPKEGPKAEGKPKGKQSAAQRIAAQGDLKPKAKAEGPKADLDPMKWRKLDQRKWIGPWAERAEKAGKGQLPDPGPAKADLANAAIADWRKASEGAFGGIFSADTHWPFRKRIAALATLIRAKDLAGLKKHDVKEISTTPIMLGKLRDLAIAALSAKAEKAKGNGKAKADPAPEAEAPQAS